MILLGDFNVFDTTDETMNAILAAGFLIPEQLKAIPSNAPQDQALRSDRLHRPRHRGESSSCAARARSISSSTSTARKTKRCMRSRWAGLPQNKQGKKRTAKERTRYYNDWRTFQMSDHLPLWIELQIDFGREYLESKIKRGSKAVATTKVAAGFVTE
jgi:hypothetical protein